MTAKSKQKQTEKRLPKPLKRLLPFGILLLLVVVFFARLLFPVFNPACWLWEDFLFQNYPYAVFSSTSLANGVFPFWNPYVFGGQPFAANTMTGVLYPLNLIEVFFVKDGYLSPYIVQGVEILHYLLAAVFTFRFLRTGGLGAEASLFGGVTFAFSGFLVTRSIHPNCIQVIIWLPLILEFFEKTLSQGKYKYMLLCAVFLFFSNLGGHPQYSLYTYYTLALYWLVYEFERRKTKEWTYKKALVRLSCLAFVTLGALGLSAFSYLPAADHAQYTHRSTMTYQASIEHSISPVLLFKLICPTFFGTFYPGHLTYWVRPGAGFWETCLFSGVLPLILALWAVRFFKGNRHVQFAVVLGGLCLWLAMGGYGLLYKLFFYFAPGFGRFRHPGRFAAFVSFALALLAAHGWSAVIEAGKEAWKNNYRKSLITTAAIVLGVCFMMLFALKAGMLDNLEKGGLVRAGLKNFSAQACIASIFWIIASAALILFAGSMRKSLKQPLSYFVILFVFIELFLFGAPFLKGNQSPDEFYQKNQVVRNIQEESKKELFRVNARSLENPRIMILRRNQGSVHRLPLIEGYNPLQIKRRLGEIKDFQRQLDLMNVKYAIDIDYDSKTVSLEPRSTYMPRAFMIHRWRIIETDEKILETLNDPQFDYRSEAVLEKDPGFDSTAEKDSISSQADVTKYSQNEIIIRTESITPGILVLSEWFYPAWKVWVDGKEEEMLRADYSLRAVALESGNHVVRFAFDSDVFWLGVKISLFTALSMLLIFLILRRWRIVYW